MRLICPKCGAQYEVPSEVIPESGRDVQCSDCGATWFQFHPDHMPPDAEGSEFYEEPPIADLPDDDLDESLPQDYGAEEDDPSASYEDDFYRDDTGEEDDPVPNDVDETDDVDETEDMTSAPVQRRELDENIAGILREEAERETKAREVESQAGLETQEELGLDSSEPVDRKRSEEARTRMARLRGEPDSAEIDGPADEMDIDPGSRRNLLPDIDEINSSLSNNAAGDETPATAVAAEVNAAKNRSGFRFGFRLAVILAVLALLLYVFAPQLAQAVPALEGTLTAYVDAINAARTGLNNLIESMVSTADAPSAAE